MGQSLFGERLILRQPFQNDCISTLRVQFDLAVGPSDNGRHSLSCRVELADIEDFKLLFLAPDLDVHRFRFAGLREKSEV